MSEPIEIRVRLVDWDAAGDMLAGIRTKVFVDGQGVPPEVERDGRDGQCAHVLAETASGEPVGTGRLMPDGRIGRMAVLEPWRGRGIGGAMLDALVAEARRRGFRETTLHAQLHAQDFYARHGFVAEGDVYLEAGIPHVLMRAAT